VGDRNQSCHDGGSGDKGYGALSNYAAIAQHGATPFIAFKSIHTGKGRRSLAKDVLPV
jgi:hypothetical protein